MIVSSTRQRKKMTDSQKDALAAIVEDDGLISKWLSQTIGDCTRLRNSRNSFKHFKATSGSVGMIHSSIERLCKSSTVSPILLEWSANGFQMRSSPKRIDWSV